MKLYKRIMTSLLPLLLLMLCVTGCGSQNEAKGNLDVEDGVYSAAFDTDSSMFHINEAYEGRGILTVENGVGTMHIVMPSQNVVNLYPGLAEDAQKDGAVLIDPVVESVTYSDGMTEDVYAFDIPVPVIGEEFDLALIGTKQKWYDHKVVVSDLKPLTDGKINTNESEAASSSDDAVYSPGTYSIDVSLEGGTGRASIESPTQVVFDGNAYTVTITWSSPHYDYMIVDGDKYLPVNTEGNSVFEITFKDISKPVTVIADTTAMSTPHEIEYVLTFDMSSVSEASAFGISVSDTSTSGTSSSDTSTSGASASQSPVSSMELKYAEQFCIDEYADGCKHIHVEDGNDYIVVPAGVNADDKGFTGATIIKQPCKSIYLAASSAMDLFRQLNALGMISACSTTADDYSMSEVSDLINSGQIRYVGKYSAPDYETLLDLECDIAIESSMIYHSPKTEEQLENLGIPVFTERSSYESEPLGRLEWIRLYGILLDKEEEADLFFDKACKQVEQMQADLERSGSDTDVKSVCFFYVSPNGYVNVRKPGDYMTKMIRIAGGSYALDDLQIDEDNALSTLNINWEDFYSQTTDADILIYNSTIYGQIDTLDDLIGMNALFTDYKAVQNGDVWCTNLNLFQETSAVADIISDLYTVIHEGRGADTKYLYHLE